MDKIIRRGIRFGGIVAILLALGACSGLSSEQQKTLNRVSSEIGGKAVLEWDLRKRAAEWLIDACRRKTGLIENRIDCVEKVLKILRPAAR